MFERKPFPHPAENFGNQRQTDNRRTNLTAGDDDDEWEGAVDSGRGWRPRYRQVFNGPVLAKLHPESISNLKLKCHHHHIHHPPTTAYRMCVFKLSPKEESFMRHKDGR